MIDNDTKRLNRLTAILIQLQSNKLVIAANLAEKYGVSNKTIYRDIKALESAGVPIVT
ncbi:MAG TPA: HTH domain-containing protein [Saprospiraceae bacterium]|nr:HTH domain-containing protein [Saprospiraceae bacterium]HPN68723.1 HTH domain-containing protein [Saprospiraceae bacterium]